MLLFGLSIPPDNVNTNPSWEYFKSELGLKIAIFLLFATIAFILQRSANRIERRRIIKQEVSDK